MPNPDLTFVDNLIGEVLRALNPGQHVRRNREQLLSMGPCRVIAVGKAAHPMAEAAAPIIRNILRGGILIAPPLKRPRMVPARGLEVYPADHPLPTARNLTAASAAAELVRAVQSDEALLVLLSGGASALLTLPAPGLTLDDLRAITGGLLRAGATIDDLNCVRKHCEQLKGGGLARLAIEAGCRRVVSLILSDVVGDRLDVIGSGPTASDPTTYADALAVLTRFALLDAAPAITAHLSAGAAGQRPETLKPGEPVCERIQNSIIGGNHTALALTEAFLSRRCVITDTRRNVTGEARDVGRDLALRTRALADSFRSGARGRRATIWGGETTVTVRGTGFGGRNQELALAAALELDGVPNVAVISFATDGVDGNSTAAGAVVTGSTAADARAAGFDPAAVLANNDSNTLFRTLDTGMKEKGRRILIQTGPTGTNVNDVMIGFAWAEGASLDVV